VFTPGLAGRQARAVIGLVRKRQGPLVLGGDLNVLPQSSAYKALRAVLQDAFPGPRGATYPARAPVIQLDYVLYRGEAGMQVDTARVLPEKRASDHRPMRVDFTFSHAQ
jgi:endonuclease/exonuclease/phosphatase (EEP) superfamily protein YafD